jgi:hypothetical protein
MITPPTDSLYKFMTVGGIVLAILSIAFIWTRIESYQERVVDAYTDAAAAKSERDMIGARIDQLKGDVAKTKEDAAKGIATSKERRDMIVDDAKGLLNVIPLNCQRVVATTTKVAELEKYREKLNWMFWLVGTFGCAGLLLAGIGFRLWYVRVQVPLDKQAAA